MANANEQQMNAVKIHDLSGSNEYPSDNDIIAALAGELMSACIRVSDGFIYADFEFISLDHCVRCEVINTRISWTDQVICSVIGLTGNSAAEELTDLIKRVEALGGVAG